MSKQDIGVKVCSKEVNVKHAKRVKHVKPMTKHATITQLFYQPIYGGITNGQLRNTR